jgi:predicted nucleic acid-binding OB-fold protein
MQITIDLPEPLLTRLNALDQSLPQVLELALDELTARPQTGFTGFAEVLEFLANLPTPEEILALRPSETLQAQIDQLSEKHKAATLTPQEKQLWQQYEYLEHIVSMAKAKAYLRLNTQAIA